MLRPSILSGLALSVAILAAPSASATTGPLQPDYAAMFVAGPGQVYADSNVIATVTIWNLGGNPEYWNDYLAEVVLSLDNVIDPTDTVVGSFESNFVGTGYPVSCYVPWGLPDSPHYWGLRITHVFDSDQTNNNLIGPMTNVMYTDLALEDPSPIQAFVRQNEPLLDPIAVRVNNDGTPNSILVFCVEQVDPAPWLVVDAPNSFAVGGIPGNDVFLYLDHKGLLPGTYTTYLKFINTYYPLDFEILEVTLTVGLPKFRAGDRIFGQIGAAGEQDELEFNAVEGMKLVMQVRSTSGDVKPKITVLWKENDDYPEFTTTSEHIVDVITLKHSNQLVKKVIKLPAAPEGLFTLRVEGADGTSGGYIIHTKRKMPKRGNSYVQKFKGLAEGETAIAFAHLLPGGMLDFSVDPNAKFEGPLGLGVTTPSGSGINLTGYTQSMPTGDVLVEGIEGGAECGCFDLAFTGFGGGAKEKLRVLVLPYQPPQGKAKVYVD
jgi:hypothetical protein